MINIVESSDVEIVYLHQSVTHYMSDPKNVEVACGLDRMQVKENHDRRTRGVQLVTCPNCLEKSE